MCGLDKKLISIFVTAKVHYCFNVSFLRVYNQNTNNVQNTNTNTNTIFLVKIYEKHLLCFKCARFNFTVLFHLY